MERRGFLATLGAFFTALRTKAQPLMPLSTRGWWPILVREPTTGAWQRNEEIRAESVIAYGAVFACVTLIASDIAKLGLRLVQQDANGIWTETENSAYSPVLRKPNHYQTRIKFVEQWLVSKLIHGNTYVLKERDARGVVVALYVLDPTRVTVLVSTSGDVFYQLKRDDLSGIARDDLPPVPAREIIHDTMVALYHPLIGVSPIYACGVTALQGLAIQNNSQKFFANGSIPGGIITIPTEISDEQAARFKAIWETNYSGENAGKVAILTNGMKYEPTAINATDAQLIDILRWTGENVCTPYRVPPFLIGVVPSPPYANSEPLLQLYYSQCLQEKILNLETCLDEGLGLGPQFGNRYGVEVDVDDLIWLDTATRTTAAQGGINASVLSPNEARKKYYGLGPVTGGKSPLSQAQYWPLDQLAERQAPGIPASPDQIVTTPFEADDDEDQDDDRELVAANFSALLHQKALAAGLYAA